MIPRDPAPQTLYGGAEQFDRFARVMNPASTGASTSLAGLLLNLTLYELSESLAGNSSNRRRPSDKKSSSVGFVV